MEREKGLDNSEVTRARAHTHTHTHKYVCNFDTIFSGAGARAGLPRKSELPAELLSI